MAAIPFVCKIAWFHNQNKVLDLIGGNQANGTHIQIYDDLGNDNQKWLFDPVGGGY